MAEIEAKCRCCGKPVSVLEPSRWGYKVKGKNGWIYYCSWKCLRADEKRIEQAQKEKQDARKAKQQEKIRNDRLEVLKGMMEAVSEGKNAYDYLKSMGYADPKDTLRRLRITAKEEAPKIYRKMEKMGLLDMRKGHSGKGVDRMSQNKLTREQKEKAVEIALSGGDYLEHLKKCGAKNPSAAWWYIRKTLAKSNPELLEEINRKTGEGAEVEVAEKLPPEAVAEVPEDLAGFVAYEPGAPEGDKTEHQGFKVTAMEETDDGVRFVMSVPPEQAEQMDKVMKDIMDPERDALCMSLYNPPKEKKMEYTVVSIKTKAGTFSIDEEERISWRGGKSCTTMKKEDWEELAEIMPEVLEILGVDAG